MKNSLTFVVALVLVLLLLIYMFTFQVRYDEVVVRTTFDSATAPTYRNGEMVDPGSLVRDAGLHFKAPWPIQNVTTFSNRVQILEDRPEQQQTRDNFAVIVTTYVTWKIQDPYAFFVTLKDEKAANDRLRTLLSEMKSIVGKYNFSEMVNTDESQLKLKDLEADAQQLLQARLSGLSPSYGIEIEHVGIKRISVPSTTSTKIFDRMRATRERLAASARATGDAKAVEIRSQAQSAQSTILSFADRRGQAIRAEGDRQAAEYYDVFKQDEQFAIFLRQMDALRRMLKNNTTFVLDAKDLEPFSPLVVPPGSVAESKK